MSDAFFAADLHFGHKFMADLRGFGRLHLEDMDDYIIEYWNRRVGKRDDVFFHGDFSFYNADLTRRCFNALNGNKFFTGIGNHDPNHVLGLPWANDPQMLCKRKFDGQTIWMCHYPLMTWANAHHGTWHTHGHSHGNGQWADSTRLDVGMDATGRVVISYDEVAKILSAREYDYIDHHKPGSD